MTPETEMTHVNALDDLLEAERTALLKGDLVALNEMLPAKESLITALSEYAEQGLPELAQLDIKVKRNQLLLNGALEGIRDVASRMAALRQTRGSLETYGSDGRKHNFEINGTHVLEKRS